jgi:hypothetical protein
MTFQKINKFNAIGERIEDSLSKLQIPFFSFRKQEWFTAQNQDTNRRINSSESSADNPSFRIVAANVMSVVSNFKTEYGSWPALTEVFYKSANKGIFPSTIDSLRLTRRIALSGDDNCLPKWSDFR